MRLKIPMAFHKAYRPFLGRLPRVNHYQSMATKVVKSLFPLRTRLRNKSSCVSLETSVLPMKLYIHSREGFGSSRRAQRSQPKSRLVLFSLGWTKNLTYFLNNESFPFLAHRLYCLDASPEGNSRILLDRPAVAAENDWQWRR